MWYSYFKITNHTAGLIGGITWLDLLDCRLQNSPEVCLFNTNVKTLHHGYILVTRLGVNLSGSNWTIIVSRSEFQSLLDDERRSLLRKWNIISGWNINVRPSISVWPHSRRWRIGNIACWSTGWILAKFGSETLIYNRTLIFVFQAGQARFLYLQSPVTSGLITMMIVPS